MDEQEAVIVPGLVGAIVCGGAARRMGGQPKGLLRVQGRTIVERQIEALSALCARVVLVTNDPAPWSHLGITVVNDRVVGQGPLAGLDAALTALNVGEEAVLVVAGDMPFLAPELLRGVATFAPAAVAVIPVGPRGAEPLLARYGRGFAEALSEALRAGQRKLQDLVRLPGVTVLPEEVLRGWDPALRSLENVNTPEDLARVG